MSEHDTRIATVRPVEESEATGRVAAIFDDIKKTKNLGSVPAFWRVIAINPVQLELVWTTLKSLMHPEASGRTSRLDPRTREVIALAVSATNGCPYCINSHTAALRKLGMDDESLGELMAIVGSFCRDSHYPDGISLSSQGNPSKVTGPRASWTTCWLPLGRHEAPPRRSWDWVEDAAETGEIAATSLGLSGAIWPTPTHRDPVRSSQGARGRAGHAERSPRSGSMGWRRQRDHRHERPSGSQRVGHRGRAAHPLDQAARRADAGSTVGKSRT